MTLVQYNTIKGMFDDMCEEVGFAVDRNDAVPEFPEIDKYFTPLGITDMREDGFTTEEMIVCRLCSSLQGRHDGNFPYAIRFNGVNRKAIQTALFDFDADKIMAAYSDWKELYRVLSSNCRYNADTSAWEDYSKGIFEGIAFLRHNHSAGFDFIKKLINLNYSDILSFQPWMQSDIQTLTCNIYGLCFPLACDWLKECGCTWIVKPDGYTRDIFRVVLYPHLDTMPQTIVETLYNAVQALKTSNPELSNLTPYILEKMIQIICSGDFYKDKIKIDKRKPVLFSALFKTRVYSKP